MEFLIYIINESILFMKLWYLPSAPSCVPRPVGTFLAPISTSAPARVCDGAGATSDA